MKNIKFYMAGKYNSPKYERVEPNIYRFVREFALEREGSHGKAITVKENLFVTSFSYEQEPELGEEVFGVEEYANVILPRYPLEDLLMQLNLRIEEIYMQHKDGWTGREFCVEVSSNDIEGIRSMCKVFGKKVRNYSTFVDGNEYINVEVVD